MGALGLIHATRPDLLDAKAETKMGDSVVWIGGLLLAVVLAILSPLASAYPDGLEWVAEQKGFLDIAQGPLYEIIPDYVMPGLANEALATIVAGLIGALIVFVVAIGTAWLRRSPSN
jgi:cobalt/nickel transport system permease protein